MLKYIVMLSLICAFVHAATFTGPDKFWRPRQNLVFFLVDEQGGGFDVNLDMRDMNTYMEGKRDAYVFIMAPDGRIVARQLLPDDGITKIADFSYKDGLWDEGMDMRVRSYAGKISRTADGLPEGKRRSPYLTRPQDLKARSFKLNVPDCGKGIYRVAIASCWDHWFSITPSRKMSAAVHSGAGPLYMHGDQLADSYMYITDKCKDLNMAIIEEIKPYNWSLKASVGQRVLGEIKAGVGFYNFDVIKDIPKNCVVRFQAKGSTTGATLHVKGNPSIFCEDAKTAFAIRGGVREKSLDVVQQYAAMYPESKSLARAAKFFVSLGFLDYDNVGAQFNEKNDLGALRSSWWSFGDGRFGKYDFPESPELKTALTDLFDKWALNRYMMEQGITVNQWAKILEGMARMYEYSKSPVVLDSLRYNVKRICTQYALGRTNPLKDGWKSGYEPDNGFIDNGIQAECCGHDCEYNLETDADLSIVYDITGMKEILYYQGTYYKLKTYLTASKTGSAPKTIFSDTFSETASNSRTRCYTHKTGARVNLIDYGNLWGGKENPVKREWPYLEEKAFVRNLDDRYFAVNTGKGAYMLFHTGPGDFIWNNWGQWKFEGNSAYIDGLTEPGYGAWQWYARKTNGFGFMWFKDFGPGLVACNHNLPYTSNVWGETMEPYATTAWISINPLTTSEVMDQTCGTFDEKNRVFTRKGEILRTPFSFTRTFKVLDNGMEGKVVIEAKDDCEMKSLYETVPLSLDRREITVNGQVINFAKAIVTPSLHTIKESEGFRQDFNEFTTDTIRIKATDTGKTLVIKFDKKYDIITATPMRYRDLGLAMSSFSLKLPVSWKKGDKLTVSYTAVLE